MTVTQRENEIDALSMDSAHKEHCLLETIAEHDAEHQREVNDLMHQIDFLAHEYKNYQDWVKN